MVKHGLFVLIESCAPNFSFEHEKIISGKIQSLVNEKY